MSFNVMIVLAIIEPIYFGVMKFVRCPSNFQVDLYTPPFNSKNLHLKSHHLCHLIFGSRETNIFVSSNHQFFVVRLEMRSNCLLLSSINARERAAWGSHSLSLGAQQLQFWREPWRPWQSTGGKTLKRRVGLFVGESMDPGLKLLGFQNIHIPPWPLGSPENNSKVPAGMGYVIVEVIGLSGASFDWLVTWL